MSFFNSPARRTGLNRSLKLEMVNTSDVEATKTVLAAARNVQKHFGVKTDTIKLATALATARSRDEFAVALEAAGMNIIDTDEAMRYRQERVKPTILERFQGWGWAVLDFLERNLMHGFIGITSAWVSFLLTVPLSISWLIDTLWYKINYAASWTVIVPPVSFLLLFIAVTATDDDGASGENEFMYWVGRIYASFNAVLIGAIPLLTISLLGGWFYKGGSPREWVVKPLKQYDQPLSNGVVLTIDQILQVTPKARIELEVLEPVVGNYQELFVTLPLGGTGPTATAKPPPRPRRSQ